MIAYKYIGKGDSIPNVPARDLTDEDMAALDAEQKAAMLASGLYEPVRKPPSKKISAKEID